VPTRIERHGYHQSRCPAYNGDVAPRVTVCLVSWSLSPAGFKCFVACSGIFADVSCSSFVLNQDGTRPRSDGELLREGETRHPYPALSER
jgi:hypothetical protein